MKFEFLEHTADIKFRAYGKNIEEKFSNSAKAMFFSMCEDSIKKTISKEIKIDGTDMKSLLYNFLEELLFLFDSEGFFLSEILNIQIDKEKFELVVKIIGDKGKGYEMLTDVKAVTYNDMEINNEFIQVVLDI